MAKKKPAAKAAESRPEPELESDERAEVNALATELFIRIYESRQGYTLESSAEKAIEDAEAFLETLHR